MNRKNRGWDRGGGGYTDSIDLNGFKVHCSGSQVAVYETSIVTLQCRESILVEIQALDDVVMSCKAEAVVTLSENTSDFLSPNKDERKEIRKFLDWEILGEIDFKNPELMFGHPK